jgi:putative heme iron utilization protein
MIQTVKDLIAELKECNQGKGYYNLSANYDDIDSRIECENCYGSGKKENEDEKTD